MNYPTFSDTSVNTIEELKNAVTVQLKAGGTIEEACEVVYTAIVAHNVWLENLNEGQVTRSDWEKVTATYNYVVIKMSKKNLVKSMTK